MHVCPCFYFCLDWCSPNNLGLHHTGLWHHTGEQQSVGGTCCLHQFWQRRQHASLKHWYLGIRRCRDVMTQKTTLENTLLWKTTILPWLKNYLLELLIHIRLLWHIIILQLTCLPPHSYLFKMFVQEMTGTVLLVWPKTLTLHISVTVPHMVVTPSTVHQKTKHTSIKICKFRAQHNKNH